ncbi:TPA: hypothetical protein ACSP7Y_002217 [Serratia fonticola]
MASSWIKIEVITPDKPEVYQLAEILDIDPDAALGKLIRLWAWADQQTIDGNAKCNAACVTKNAVDRITFVRGFAEALIQVGWLAMEGNSLIFPNFERHNGNSSKKRALTNDRVTKMREMKRNVDANGNAGSNAKGVTGAYQKALPEEEEEEDLKDPPLPPKGKTRAAKFNPLETALPDWLSGELWAEWVEYRKQLKKPIKTQKGIVEMLNNLESFRENGHSPEIVIRQSIANEWQGLFEPRRGNENAAGNIDYEGAFYRLVLQGGKPQNEAEKKAQKQAQSAGLKRRNEVQAHSAWRGYLSQAYKETGEQPYTGG